MSISGILLAAGASSRAGFPKILARIQSQSFGELAVSALASLDEIVVVVAEPHAAIVRSALARRRVRFVENPEPERGMLSSLQVGLASLPRHSEAAVVSLIDHPRVRRTTVDDLVGGWRRTRAPFVRPMFHGRGGHPFLIARSAFSTLLSAPPRDSTKSAIARLALCVDLELGDPGVLDDFDAPRRPATVQSAAR